MPYFMKVDIEGADLLCLEGLAPFDEVPLFLSTEYPMSLTGQIRVLLLLRKLGYRRFQVIDQKSVPAQIPPHPAREGQYVDVTSLEFNGSGLFGKELPRWRVAPVEQRATHAFRETVRSQQTHGPSTADLFRG